MRTIHRDCVIAIIISKDNKILMGRKNYDSRVYPDCWHLVGGGIDEGESQAEALKREVKEEAGIDIGEADVKMIDDTTGGESEKRLKDTGEIVFCIMKFFVYRIRLAKNAEDVALAAEDDLDNLTWFDMDKLLEQKLTPPSEAFFKAKMHLLD